MKTTRHTTKLLSLLIGSLFVSTESQANPPAANALPTGGKVTSGIGSISAAGNTLSVTQNSQNLFTQFDSFNIGSAAAVRFLQPNSSSLVVSRILGSDPSQVYGKLSATGQLFLLNPNGIVFGPGSQVNVGSLIASTLQLSDKDILSGQYAFTQGEGAGAIRNFGELIAKEGGLVALVAPQVENQGLIRADRGQIALAAGNSVRLEIGQGGLVGVNVDAGLAQAQIDNSGSIFADGGKVWMTARQAGEMLSTAVNQTGVIRANTLADSSGEIRIDGGPQGKLVLAGDILAMGTNAGEKGGRISATANQVQVNGKINASGANGGGYIEIGGGFQGKNARLNNAERVALANTAVVQANATQNGDGGTAVVWSEKRSDVYGVMEAKGAGSGLGGLVETSSRGELQLNAKVDVSAESGVHGTWLLDPTSIKIGNANANPTVGTNAVATVDATNISAALTAGSNVIVQGTDGIQIDADISKTGGARSSLTFEAPGAINLGTVNQSRQISATDAPNSGVTSSLDVTFSPGANPSTAPVTLFGSISTNGGNVVFNKDAVLSAARPISTSVSQPNNGTPASNVSGNITFNEKVNLSGSNPVTLDTQSVKDGGGNAISQGGNIVFAKALDSLGTGNLPVALTLNTTGTIVQGGNQSGSVTFKDNVGSVAMPLRSLTINGPSKVFLEGSQINLKNDGGAVMTFSAPGQIRPALILNNPNTVINVAGFGTSGTSNYLQSTFDIIKGTAAAVNTADASLTINSDRSIQILDRDILGASTGTSEPTNKLLNVTLNSNKLGNNSGSISLEGQRGVKINTFGGTITLAGGTDGTGRAFGVSGEQNTDGILLQNSVLDSTGGPNGGANVTLRGSSPQSNATGGTAVRLFGTTTVTAGTKDILIDGVVNSTSSGAAKDAVLIGSGGTAGVNILTEGTGKITIQGDASGVGLVAQAGASYNGVELSRGANIRTVQGDILIKGIGGGGNNVNVGENMGVRLKDSDTQINSQTGNITIIGQTGGKTSSYGITASGDDMAIGQRRDQTLQRNPVNTEPFTGNINLVADSMKFVNNSSTRLRVTTKRQNAGALGTGQINIRSLHDVDIQIGGTEPSPATSTNVANPDKPLYLAGEIFSGSNAVMIPGSGEINIGQFGDPNASQGAVIAETTKTISVDGATTVRDPLNLLARGTGGKVALNGNLTVQGTVLNDTARTLNIESDTTVIQTTSASVAAANLRVDAGGNVLLVGPNQIGTIAAQTNGNFSVANAQALTVGTVSRNFQTNTATTSGINTQKTGPAVTDRFLSISTNGANADLTITQALNNPGGLISLAALGETLSVTERGNAINQTGAGTFKGGDLIVRAQDNSNLTLTGNEFSRLAVDLSTGQGDLSLVRSAATAGNIDINTLTLPTLATGANTATVVTGVKSNTTNGQVYIQNLNGGLVQGTTSPVVVAGLAADVTTSIDLSTSSTNQIGSLAALTGNGSVNVSNQSSLRVDTVVTQNNQLAPANLKTLSGVRAQGANQGVTLAVTGAGSTLTVANVDNTPEDPNTNNAISSPGSISLSTTTGAIDSQGALQGTGANSDITLTTAGGNIGLSNTATAERSITATVTTGAGSISTTAAGTLTAKAGSVTLGTVTGAIDTKGSVSAAGANSDIVYTTAGGNISASNTLTADRNVSLTVTTGAGTISTTDPATINAKNGNITLTSQTGLIETKGILQAAGTTADITLSTAGGNISTFNSLTADRNVTATVTTGAGSISTAATSPITAKNGNVALSTQTGLIDTKGTIQAQGATADITLSTAGGNISAANTITADRKVTATVSAGTGTITTTNAAAIKAKNGNVALSTQTGLIETKGTLEALGATSDIILTTAGGSISTSNSMTADRNVTATVTTGAGSIFTAATSPVVAKNGNVTFTTQAGLIDTQGTVQAIGTTADITFTTAGGNISTSNAVTADRSVTATVTTGAGSINTAATSPIKAKGGTVTLSAQTGPIDTKGTIEAIGAESNILLTTMGGNIAASNTLTADRSVILTVATGAGNITTSDAAAINAKNGNVIMTTQTGLIDIKGTQQASGAFSDITLTTSGGNITVGNTASADRQFKAAVTKGTGSIFTTAAAPILAKAGGISMSTLTGQIDTKGTLQSNGATSDILLSTTGGNISVSNTATSQRDVSMAVTTGAGSISTSAAATITAVNGGVSMSTVTGQVDSKGAISAGGKNSDVTINTSSGNIALANTVVSQRNVLANVATGAGSITTDSNATLTANNGGVTLGTNSGAISIGAKVETKNGDIIAQSQTTGNITVGAAMVADNATRTADIVLSTATGLISIGVPNPVNSAQGDLTTSPLGDVRLLASAITQHSNSEIVTGAISAKATGTQAGDVSLRGDNNFGVLAASSAAGQIHVKNTNTAGTVIGTVEGDTRVPTLSAITAPGQFTLQSGGTVTQLGGTSGAINAGGGVYMEATAGNVLLNNPLNNFNAVAVKADTQLAQQVALNSSNSIELGTLTRANLDGTITAHSGVSTQAGSGQVSINTPGTLSQKAGAKVVTHSLAAQATQSISLGDGGNSIDSLSAVTQGDVTLVNNKTLTLSSLSNQASTQVQSGLITGLGKQASLQIAGSLNQTAPLVSSMAAIYADNEVTLGSTGNDIGQLAVKAAKLDVYDNNGLQISSLGTPLTGSNANISGLDANEIRLQSVGDITQQANANIKSSTLAINTQALPGSTGNVRLSNAQNQINNFAAQIGGSGDIFSANSINLITASGISGVTAATGLQLRSLGDITIQPGHVVSNLVGELVLSAGGAFNNLGGTTGVQAPGGRWLIYDSNPNLDISRFGGLIPNFRRFSTSYAKYSPSQVIEAGNGYLTDAVALHPNEAIRQNGGLGNGTAQTSYSSLESLQNVMAVPAVYASINGSGLPDFPTVRPAFTEGGVTSARFDVPVLVQVTNRVPFSIALNTLVGAEQVKDVTMRDGSPLPNWIRFDPTQGVIVGRVPNSQNEPFTLAVNRIGADGQANAMYVFINPSPIRELDE